MKTDSIVQATLLNVLTKMRKKYKKERIYVC